jgi:hypothetical protein
MNFPASHPTWMWVYFGVFGSAGVVLFSLIAWTWMRLQDQVSGRVRTASRWGMLGCMFLFFAAWFACGIGGPPGNMLSPDPSVRNSGFALAAAAASMFFSAPGWGCLLVGLRKIRPAVSDAS